MRVRLNVFFDGSLWVGIFERHDESGLSVGRVVFGAEPSGPELYNFILSSYPVHVRFGHATEEEAAALDGPKNPKRAQREARRALDSGVSRKAWEAMRLAQEAAKQESRTRSREEREAEAQRKFELRQEKRKKKHRGH